MGMLAKAPLIRDRGRWCRRSTRPLPRPYQRAPVLPVRKGIQARRCQITTICSLNRLASSCRLLQPIPPLLGRLPRLLSRPPKRRSEENPPRGLTICRAALCPRPYTRPSTKFTQLSGPPVASLTTGTNRPRASASQPITILRGHRSIPGRLRCRPRRGSFRNLPSRWRRQTPSRYLNASGPPCLGTKMRPIARQPASPSGSPWTRRTT